MELIPRIVIFTALVAPPGLAAMRTPGALPYRAAAKLGEPACVSSSALIVLTAYPSAFCCLVIPSEVTTTSFMAAVPACNTMAIFSVAATS